MAGYRVLLDRTAQRDLERLPSELASRVTSRLLALGSAPRGPGVLRLTGRADHRVRVGDHRVIFEIDDEARTVRVLRVRHRSQAYRRLSSSCG